MALRNRQRHVPRLVGSGLENDGPDEEVSGKSFRLEIRRPGVLDDLVLKAIGRPGPPPGEVEIEVKAAGLNFRDVLNALGMYPGDAGLLGGECAGTITAVGSGVDGFQAGQEVLAIASGCFGSHVCVPAICVWPKPRNLSFQEAATIPIAFLTARYGLENLAGIKATDRVLIHAASGGVGCAAVQIVRRSGARLYATASPTKWPHLRSQGVENIMNSRSLDFAREIMDLTDGKGVDIVLNSLAGEFIPKGLEILAPGGRFLEIGKREIWSQEQVRAVRPDVSYFPYDLAQLLLQNPADLNPILGEVLREIEAGSLKPIPHRDFPIESAASAFRFMAQARHVGKVVISTTRRSQFLRGDRTYVITGGLGAIGKEIAAWMVGQGARHLALLSRSAPSDASRRFLDRLERAGARVAALRADVSHYRKPGRERPIVLVGLASDRRRDARSRRPGRCSSPEAELGQICQGDGGEDLRRPQPPPSHPGTAPGFFILFSSVASVIGSPGQGNYAAGNALDALAHHRRSLGLPATSINGGPWEDSGMAARTAAEKRGRWAALGVQSIPSDRAGPAFPPARKSQVPDRGRAYSVEGFLHDDPAGGRAGGSARNRKILQRRRRPPGKFRSHPIVFGRIAAWSAAQAAAMLHAHVMNQVGKALGLTSADRPRPPGWLEFAWDGFPDGGRAEIPAAGQPRLLIAGDFGLRISDHRSDGRIYRQRSPWSGWSSLERRRGEIVRRGRVGRDRAGGGREPGESRRFVRGGNGPLARTETVLDREGKMSSANHRELLKRALLAVEDLQARLPGRNKAARSPSRSLAWPAAFRVMSCNPDHLWHRLRDGVDAVKEVPRDRWDVDRYFDPDPDAPGKMYTRWGAFLDGIDGFDPAFFRISPREAGNMDPQHRVLLEVAWEALENAGRSPATLQGSSTGVFVGISTNDFSHFTQLKAQASDLASIDCYLGTGNAFCVASGRISHFLGVQGPCVAVDTACSSSLVAVDLACQHLRSGRCDLALAGGVNAILSPGSTVYFSKARAMAADGRCKTFDASADGYVRGEGCGVVVLKRLGDARRDRDRILAIVRGTAVNHDGPSGGLTVPNGQAQEAVIRAALADAGVGPGEVDYVEAHGTGTPLGDPIEVRALARVFGPGRSLERPLWLGSIKTNIGHLEAAAGVAGLMKVVLSLQHRQMPAHLHFERPNPHIDWERIPVRVVKGLRAWEKEPEGRRMAGVSSFGFGGTNAHVVIEEGDEPRERKGGVDRPLHVVALSARSEEALGQLAERYAGYLRAHGEVALADVGYTANTGRSHFGCRLAVVGKDGEEVRGRLEAAGKGMRAEGMWRGQVESRPRVAFLFSGQGAQHGGMGRELYETQPAFRRAIERCGEILKGKLRWPLTEVMWGAQSGLLDETEFTQPAVFALEYGLAQLWRSWGVEPGAVMGHSVGEYVAACVAGVFGLEEGLELVAQRAGLMQRLAQPGEMAAVSAGGETVAEVVRRCGSEVSIAALNGPRQTVISGLKEGMGAVLEALRGTRRGGGAAESVAWVSFGADGGCWRSLDGWRGG